MVGAHLLFELCQRASEIYATYRNEDKVKRIRTVFSYYTDNPDVLLDKINWVQADVTDVVSLESVFPLVKKVYHAAALVSFDPKDDKRLLKTNIEGTANIVNLCLKHNIEKLCFVSSIAALGPSIKNRPITEENEGIDSSTTYAISKHYAEMEVWRATQEGIPVVIVNPGVIIAPGFWKSSSGSLFYQAYKGANYYLPSGTGFVGVNDVVQAMIKLMSSEIVNERFILVNQNWTYQYLAKLLAKGLKKSPPKKEIPIWMLNLFWRLDWLRANLFGKQRRLTKNLAQLFKHRDIYDNSKLITSIDFKYEDLEASTQKYSAIFLEEQVYL